MLCGSAVITPASLPRKQPCAQRIRPLRFFVSFSVCPSPLLPLLQMLFDRTVGSGATVLNSLVDSVCK